jgi:O-antigen/teichoic acid export membrane protein
LYPHIAGVKRASPHSALKIIRASFFGVIALSVCISAAVAIFARPACQFFLGASFRHSGGVLECLSPLPVLYGLISVLGAQTMLIFEMDAVFSRIMLTGALAGIPVTALFSHYLGAKGAALGSVIMAAAIVFAMFVALRSKGLHIWKDLTRVALPLQVSPLLEPE